MFLLLSFTSQVGLSKSNLLAFLFPIDWLQDSEQDEYEAPDLRLMFQDPDHQEATLSSLNTLRKGAQFCDVFLEINGREIAGHRAVLACASVYLFELFRMEGENNCPAHFKLEGFDYDSFNILVEYAYTSKWVSIQSSPFVLDCECVICSVSPRKH